MLKYWPRICSPSSAGLINTRHQQPDVMEKQKKPGLRGGLTIDLVIFARTLRTDVKCWRGDKTDRVDVFFFFFCSGAARWFSADSLEEASSSSRVNACFKKMSPDLQRQASRFQHLRPTVVPSTLYSVLAYKTRQAVHKPCTKGPVPSTRELCPSRRRVACERKPRQPFQSLLLTRI